MDAIHTQLIISSLRTRKDNSIGLSAETPELTDSEKLGLFQIVNKNLVAYFKPLEGPVGGLITVSSTLLEGKTPSQRLRNVLYLCFTRGVDILPNETFDQYYARKTETIIEHFKSKIEEAS